MRLLQWQKESRRRKRDDGGIARAASKTTNAEHHGVYRCIHCNVCFSYVLEGQKVPRYNEYRAIPCAMMLLL